MPNWLLRREILAHVEAAENITFRPGIGTDGLLTRDSEARVRLTDGSHVGGAAIGAFCAVVIAAAAHDDRERHFAADPGELFAQWADGLADAGISRIIVVAGADELPNPLHLDRIGAEYVFVSTVGRTTRAVVTDIVAAEAAERL